MLGWTVFTQALKWLWILYKRQVTLKWAEYYIVSSVIFIKTKSSSKRLKQTKAPQPGWAGLSQVAFCQNFPLPVSPVTEPFLVRHLSLSSLYSCHHWRHPKDLLLSSRFSSSHWRSQCSVIWSFSKQGWEKSGFEWKRHMARFHKLTSIPVISPVSPQYLVLIISLCHTAPQNLYKLHSFSEVWSGLLALAVHSI